MVQLKTTDKMKLFNVNAAAKCFAFAALLSFGLNAAAQDVKQADKKEQKSCCKNGKKDGKSCCKDNKKASKKAQKNAKKGDKGCCGDKKSCDKK